MYHVPDDDATAAAFQLVALSRGSGGRVPKINRSRSMAHQVIDHTNMRHVTARFDLC